MKAPQKVKKISCRGLACVPVSKRRKISKMGALALQASGRAYKWDSKTARKAGKKGIESRLLKNKSV